MAACGDVGIAARFRGILVGVIVGVGLVFVGGAMVWFIDWMGMDGDRWGWLVGWMVGWLDG